MHEAAGGAAWPREGVGQDKNGGTVLGGEDSLVGTGERRGSHPAGRTFPGDLVREESGIFTRFLQDAEVQKTLPFCLKSVFSHY